MQEVLSQCDANCVVWCDAAVLCVERNINSNSLLLKSYHLTTSFINNFPSPPPPVQTLMSDSREVQDFLVRLKRVRNDLAEASVSCQIVLKDLEKNKQELARQTEAHDNFLRLEHKLKGDFIKERIKLEDQSAELNEFTLRLAELRKHRQKVSKQQRTLDQELANTKIDYARTKKEANEWRQRAQESSKKLEKVNAERIKRRDAAEAKEKICEELLSQLDHVKEEVHAARQALQQELCR